MKLVKISDTWINMDQVVHIDDRDNHITVSFAGASEGQRPYNRLFEETSAVQALREWLRHNDEDIDRARRSARMHNG